MRWLPVLLVAGCSILTDPGQFEEQTGETDAGADGSTPDAGDDNDATEPDSGEDGGIDAATGCDPEGADCPQERPRCVLLEGEPTCVECVAPLDCGDQVCDLDSGDCVEPPIDCADCDGQACVLRGGSTQCLACDLDLDEGLACREECIGPDPVACDCDDDGDGFVSDALDCLDTGTFDCDDTTPDLRPVLRMCGDVAPTCIHPFDSLRGTSAEFDTDSFATFRLEAVPPDWAENYRPPMSVVIPSPGIFDVYFLDDLGTGGLFRELVRVRVEHNPDGTFGPQSVQRVPVNALHMQAISAPNHATLIAMLERTGDQADAITISATMGSMGCTELRCEIHRMNAEDQRSFNPPIAFNFSESTFGGMPEPRVYWFDDRPVGGFGARTSFLRMFSPSRRAEIEPTALIFPTLRLGQFPATPGQDIAAVGYGAAVEALGAERMNPPPRYMAWAAPPSGDNPLPYCSMERGCEPVPLGPGAPESFGGLPSLLPAGPPSGLVMDPNGGSLEDSDVVGIFPGKSPMSEERRLYVNSTQQGCGGDGAPACPGPARLDGIDNFTVHDSGFIEGPIPTLEDDVVVIGTDQPAPGGMNLQEALLVYYDPDELRNTTDVTMAVEPLGRLPLGMATRTALRRVYGTDIAVRNEAGYTTVAYLLFGQAGNGDTTMFLYVARMCR